MNWFHCIKIFFRDDIDWEKIRESLKSIQWSKELNNENCDSNLKKFYDLCYTACQDKVPAKADNGKKKKIKS